MKATISVFAVTTALCGCATTNGMLDKPADTTLTSAQSPDALEQCIGLAFSTFDGVSVIHGEHRRTLSVGERGSSAFVVTILDGPPVLIEVRAAYGYPKHFRERVERCAATGHWQA